MDRCRVTSSFNGVPPQIGIANFFPTAPSQISLPPKLLLADSQIFPFPRPDSAKLPGDCLTQIADDTEISIFDADRYFNGNQDSTEQRESSVDGFSRSFRPRSFRATPAASSEASWNSQTGLLRKQRENLSVSVRSFPNGEQKKEQSSSVRYFFGCRCPCAGKKSVDVEERESETKNSPAAKTPNSRAGQAFPAPEIVRRVVDSGGIASVDPGRVSLEVFRPPETVTPLGKSVEFHKSPFGRVSGDRLIFKIPGSPNLHLAADEDAASDASSDLFEIESLSTQIGFRRRDSLDEEAAATASIAPSECYPPSEVSVDWSVITAEGYDRSSVANFSSAVSEYEELRYAAETLGGWKKKGIGGGGGLLSCRSEKAVNVIRPQPTGPTWFEPGTQRRIVKSNYGLDRVVGVARLGGGNPAQSAHDGSIAFDIRGRSSMIEPAKPDQVLRRVGLLR